MDQKYLYMETIGCQMNVSDSEKMAALLRKSGYVRTDVAEQADLILLNTCSVRKKAEEKVYSYLGKFRLLKDTNPRLILGVAGCVAQQEGERILKKVPYVDIVFGTHNLHLLPDLVAGASRGERRAATNFMESDERLDLFPAQGETEGVTAFVTIMQGCDNFCSYCIVPYVRGREISRRPDEVLAEVRGLAEKGVREVTLLGQNVNSYGLKSSDGVDFATLLKRVAAVDGIERIRFTTSHPKDISPALVECFATMEKLCPHLHLPAQSGNDRILSAMNRGYTRAGYLETVRNLRSARPDLQLTTDIIVGFPGETEAEFEDSYSLVEEVRYSDIFSFIYSTRPETKAAALPDPFTYDEKQQWLDRLQVMQRKITRQINESYLGTVQPVLVEGRSKRGDQVFGRTGVNRIVNFGGDEALKGRVVPVRITEAYQNSLLGELVE